MPVPHGGAETEVSMTPTVTDTPTGTTADGAVGSLTAKVTELLNQEKWTRAALNSYVTSNFVELDGLLEDAKSTCAAIATASSPCTCPASCRSAADWWTTPTWFCW